MQPWAVFFHSKSAPFGCTFSLSKRWFKSRSHIFGNVKNWGINSVSTIMLTLLFLQTLVEEDLDRWLEPIFDQKSGEPDALVVLDLFFRFLQFLAAEYEHVHLGESGRLYVKYIPLFEGFHYDGMCSGCRFEDDGLRTFFTRKRES